jgi:hypothetical protein
MHVTCPTHLILLDLIALIILWRCTSYEVPPLCSLLQPPATSSLSGPNVLLSILFSNILNILSSLSVKETKFQTHAKQWIKL